MQFAGTELVRSARDINLDAGESSDGLKSLIMNIRRGIQVPLYTLMRRLSHHLSTAREITIFTSPRVAVVADESTTRLQHKKKLQQTVRLCLATRVSVL